MVFVDIYNADTYAILASFEVEFEWQYEGIITFENMLTENQIKYIEITTYQED